MKATKFFRALMITSVVLVILSALINLTDTVAIMTGVIGTYEGGGYSIIALLFGILAMIVFAFAYRKAVWNWFIRGSLIGLGAIIFTASLVGLTDNWVMKVSSGDEVFRWSEEGQIVRLVSNPILHVDFDIFLLLMFLGSIGIIATALWGAFKWEAIKLQERRQDQIQGVLEEFFHGSIDPEANLVDELELRFQNRPTAPGTQPGTSAQIGQSGSSTAEAKAHDASSDSHGAGRRNRPRSPIAVNHTRQCPQCDSLLTCGLQVCSNCGTKPKPR